MAPATSRWRFLRGQERAHGSGDLGGPLVLRKAIHHCPAVQQLTAGEDQSLRVSVRDVSLYVDVVGHGDPLVLMHGGPSADLWTMGAFRECRRPAPRAGGPTHQQPVREDRGPPGRHRALRGARRAAAEARLDSRAGRAPAGGGARRCHRGPGERADLPSLSDTQTSEGTDGTGAVRWALRRSQRRWGPAPGEDPTGSRLADEVQVVDVEELDAEGAGCAPPPWPPRPGPAVMVFRSLLTSSITGDPDFVPNTS